MKEAGKKIQDEMRAADLPSRSAGPAAAPHQNGMRPVETDDPMQEIESLRLLLSKLIEACTRIGHDLDLNSFLQEVIDNARYLTGARYGALLTYKQSGEIDDFITSGLSPQEREHFKTSPRGLGLLGFMNEIEGPLRLTDIASHPSSVGFPDNHPPMKTFLGMPIRHSGERLGNIYLTEKDGGREFTAQDQDALTLFGCQAGSVIFNTRRYQEEQRARADLEALANISPVGVVVFDAETGDLVSANDEMRRLVGKHNKTGRPLSELLEVMTIRRVDGSLIPVDELPHIKALRDRKTVVAEELVIQPPSGQAITALVNARPIPGEDGDIVSVVATVQNITPLEETKRQRTEFLNNLSHRLQTPLSAIKGSTYSLLSSTHPLDPAETAQFLRVIDEQSDHMRQLIRDLVDVTQIETGTLSINPEPAVVADLLDEAREAQVRATGEGQGVDLDLPSDLPRVMADRRRILQVLSTLNAAVSAHSPKPSSVRISASRKDLYVALTVANRVDPLPPQHLGRLSRNGNGTAGIRNGRDDLDMPIAVGIIEAHGGRLSVEEGQEGRGSGFSFTLPVVDEAGYVADQERSLSLSARDSHMERARVLAIGDGAENRRYIRNILSQAGFIAQATDDLDEAERLIEGEDVHVVLLEPVLPAGDGLKTLTRLCRISDAPVIFVAGPGWSSQIGRAFELGAFDYIATPFTSTELLARVDVALRKSPAAGWIKPSGRHLHGDLAIDLAKREVSVDGQPVHLTATEFKLLAELSAAAGRVMTHEQLLRRVWGPLYSSDPRIVRTYVKELRYKLGDDAARPKYIFTETGVGYRMAGPPTS